VSRRQTIKSPHQDGQVGTEEVGEQDSRNDYGIADDDALAQELIVVGAEVKLFAVVADAGEDEADEDTSLKMSRHFIRGQCFKTFYGHKLRVFVIC
jgi:hypothetical protein